MADSFCCPLFSECDFLNKYNFLYYFPEYADTVYKNNRKSKEFKKAKKFLISEIGRYVIINGLLCPENSYPQKLSKKYSRLLMMIFPLAFLFFIWIIMIASITEIDISSDIYNIILTVLSVSSFIFIILLIITLICLLSFRKKLLAYYLKNYIPRCTHYSDNIRIAIAKAGFDMMCNQEEIQGGEDPEDCEITDCACAFCMKYFKSDSIAVFDDYTAVCPICGNKSVIPNCEHDITDKFLLAVHGYWFGNV